MHRSIIIFITIGLLASGAIQADRAAAQETLTVSEDGRRLVRSDGTAFFWLGDTAWELFHRTTRDEAELYLEDRARKGFTVIQAVILAELDGLHTPNVYSELPLIDADPTRPNEAYFEHVDFVVEKAAELGMFVGLLPTWGDKFNKRWGVGPEVFTPDNARVYGEFLGTRYSDASVIWILGGDRAPEEDEDLAIIRAMAEGIRTGDGDRHLMTYHPMGGHKSWEWFHSDDWLDFNLFQSSHGAGDLPNYRMTAEGYALDPIKPVIDGEPRYEDHPIDWNPENGWFEEFDVRQAAYWSMLSGAAGHTYGNHNIWQMWEPGREPISSARTPWREALAHPGAAQVGFMKELFLSRDFLRLVPDQQLVDSTFDGAQHIRVARDRYGRYMIAYSPYGHPLHIAAARLPGARFHAWWFDPRTGAATEIGFFDRSDRLTFDPPGESRRGNDWVLVVDDVGANFLPPGTP